MQGVRRRPEQLDHKANWKTKIPVLAGCAYTAGCSLCEQRYHGVAEARLGERVLKMDR